MVVFVAPLKLSMTSLFLCADDSMSSQRMGREVLDLARSMAALVELGARKWELSELCFKPICTVLVFLVEGSLLTKPSAGQLPTWSKMSYMDGEMGLMSYRTNLL